MKRNTPILLLLFIVASCQAPIDNSASEAFAKNAETIKAYLEAFQNENLDNSHYADDYVQLSTSYDAPKDSLNQTEVLEMYKGLWANHDFKMNTDPLNLLPGVDTDTKKMDGSVRLYSQWNVTSKATGKSGNLDMYQSFDFNEDGKIDFSVTYADFGAFFGAINTPDEPVAEETESQ